MSSGWIVLGIIVIIVLFAIGAYTYGVAASWQVAPDWSSFWEPFQWLGLVARFHEAGGDVVHFQVSFCLMMPAAAALRTTATAWSGGSEMTMPPTGSGRSATLRTHRTPSIVSASGCTG